MMQIICLMLFRQHAFLLREKLCFCLEKLSVFLCFFLEHARCPTGDEHEGLERYVHLFLF